MPRIHFISLFSVKNDFDLLPFFIEHYDELGLDNYAVLLHESTDREQNALAAEALKAMQWRFKLIPEKSGFGDGVLKATLVEQFRSVLPKEDYLLCADADEFQNWIDRSPQEVVEEGFDLAVGRRFDRFSEGLVAPEEGAELEAVYPIENPDLSRILYPRKPRLRDKIILSRASIPVDFKRCAKVRSEGVNTFKILRDIPIYHFKWREGIFDRLRTRGDYTPEEINSIKQFFEAKNVEA